MRFASLYLNIPVLLIVYRLQTQPKTCHSTSALRRHSKKRAHKFRCHSLTKVRYFVRSLITHLTVSLGKPKGDAPPAGVILYDPDSGDDIDDDDPDEDLYI